MSLCERVSQRRVYCITLAPDQSQTKDWGHSESNAGALVRTASNLVPEARTVFRSSSEKADRQTCELVVLAGRRITSAKSSCGLVTGCRCHVLRRGMREPGSEETSWQRVAADSVPPPALKDERLDDGHGSP